MVSTMTISDTTAVFIFNGTQIHAFADGNGETWFSASDVCAALGYINDSDAINKYCREKGIAKHGSLAEGNNQELTYINEGNLYRLIINSREEELQAFEVKVTEEILPAIRKAGNCTTPHNAGALSLAQQNALRQIISQRSVNADVWSNFNDHSRLAVILSCPQSVLLMRFLFLPRCPRTKRCPVRDTSTHAPCSTNRILLHRTRVKPACRCPCCQTRHSSSHRLCRC